MAIEIHKGDIGTIFEITLKDGKIVVDVSTASIKNIFFQKPSGIILTKAAAFTTDGVDGKIQYTTIAADLDEIGDWELQAGVTLAAGTWKSSIEKFQVFRNLA